MLRFLVIGSLALVLSVGVAVSDATAVDYIDPCAGYAGYQDADLAFLAGGGPDVDTALLDLDGDGYPCEDLIGAPFEAVDAEIGVYPRGGNAAAGLPRPDEQLNDTPVDSPSPPADEPSASDDPSASTDASADASASDQPLPSDRPSASSAPSRSDEPSNGNRSSETLTFALPPSDMTDDARSSEFAAASASAPTSASPSLSDPAASASASEVPSSNASPSDSASAVASPSVSPAPTAPTAPPDDGPVLTGVLAPDAISIAASTLVDVANAGTFAFFGDTGAGEGMGLDGYTPLAGLTLTVRDQASGAVVDRGTSDANGLILLDGQTGAPFSLEIDGASCVSQPYQLADGQRMGLWLASYIAAPTPPVVEAPPIVDVPQPVTVTLDPPIAIAVAEPQSATVDFSPVGGTALILPTAGTGPADGSGTVPTLAAILALLAALAAAAVALTVLSRPGSPAPTAVRANPSIRKPGR